MLQDIHQLKIGICWKR